MDTIFHVQRPPMLAAMLEITNETENIDAEIFSQFLKLSQRAAEQAVDSRLIINGSVKYRISSKALERSHGPVPDNAVSGTNSSLIDIFQYYAALEPPNAIQAKTFSDVLETNDTMELVEFSTFLQDFRVVPRLLTRREVRDVWQSISADFVAAGKGTFKKMDFECFKDAIIRLGICSFCKAGLRNLITKVNGFSLNARHAVDYMCKYLHLEDEQWVQNHIAIVGKESQGARNYRSQGEIDELAVARLAEERQVARLEHRGKQSAAAAVKKKKGHLKKPTQKKFASAADSIHTNPATSLLPEHLKQQLYPEFYGLQAMSVHEDDEPEPIDIQPSLVSNASLGQSLTDSNTALTQVSLENADHPLSIIKKYYDSSLIKMVSRYCVAQEHQMCTRYIHAEGAFLDMGILPVGSRCQVRFTITNKSRDALFFDVQSRELQCDEVCIKTQAAALIPGLPRVIDVAFAVGRGDRSVIGFVDLYYMAAGSTIESIISCPIYYRVGIPMYDTRTICTVHTINSLVARSTTTANSKIGPSHLPCTMTTPRSRMGTREYIDDKGDKNTSTKTLDVGISMNGTAARALRTASKIGQLTQSLS